MPPQSRSWLDKAKAEFIAWFEKEYPPNCILHKPAWHAPKIFRAAEVFIDDHTPRPKVAPPLEPKVFHPSAADRFQQQSETCEGCRRGLPFNKFGQHFELIPKTGVLACTKNNAAASENRTQEPGKLAEVLAEARGSKTYRQEVAALSSDRSTDPFQERVLGFVLACFSAAIAADKVERNHRFLEEALELVQAIGCTASEAHQLVDYVYGRPAGEPHLEAGGVMVTLAALCTANGLDMVRAGEDELARVWGKIDVIREKQRKKPKHSPLPEVAPNSAIRPSVPDVELLLDNAATASQVRELLRKDDGEETVLREAVRRNVYEPLARLLGEAEGAAK